MNVSLVSTQKNNKVVKNDLILKYRVRNMKLVLRDMHLFKFSRRPGLREFFLRLLQKSKKGS